MVNSMIRAQHYHEVLPTFCSAFRRVLVRVVLGYLAPGETTEHILCEFPSLTEGDVRAVIAFVAASARYWSRPPSAVLHARV
jgi:hypothetical protein